MSTTRDAAPGSTRKCPHCRATILESAVRCPGCNHHLKFDPSAAARANPSFSPLRVEGTIHHPSAGEAWEYSIVLSVRNEKGEEITRQVVGVGSMQSEEERTFTVSVEVFTPPEQKAAVRAAVLR